VLAVEEKEKDEATAIIMIMVMGGWHVLYIHKFFNEA
jgi:hypothetical protein